MSWSDYRRCGGQVNGLLRYKGGYKKGKMHGSFITYNEDGGIEKRYTGTFENGVKVSD